MAIALIFAVIGALLLHWSEWYKYGAGFECVVLNVFAALFFAVAFVIVCVSI